MSNKKSIHDMMRKTAEARQRGSDDQPQRAADIFRKPASELDAQINVRLTREFRNKLNAYCSMTGTTVQELVPTLLEEHMRDNPVDL